MLEKQVLRRLAPPQVKKQVMQDLLQKNPRRGRRAMTTDALLSEEPASRTEKTGYRASGEVSSNYRLLHLMLVGGNESAQLSGLACDTRLLPATC